MYSSVLLTPPMHATRPTVHPDRILQTPNPLKTSETVSIYVNNLVRVCNNTTERTAADARGNKSYSTLEMKSSATRDGVNYFEM